MKFKITADQAIQKGQIMVNLPTIFVMFALPFVIYYTFDGLINSVYLVFISIAFGIIMSWIIWSLLITKWRIWAFSNVRNVHELKQKAISERLIWPDGSIFEKTEIRTKVQKNKLLELNNNFQEADIYKDDNSIPIQTKIYYSKISYFFEMIASIITIGVGINMAIFSKNNNIVLGIIMIIISTYYLYKLLKNKKTNIPEIIIDNNGIETKSLGFIPWSLIKNEQVTLEGFGDSTKKILYFVIIGNRIEKIELNDLGISKKKLVNILIIYRLRYHNSLTN